MAGIRDQNKLDKLRERLYERGVGPKPRQRFKLDDQPTEVNETWSKPPEASSRTTPPPPPPDDTPAVAADDDSPNPPFSSMTLRTRGYRSKLLLIGLAFFVLAVAISSALIIFQPKSISGENISFTLQGPFTIGGGEVMPLTVGITNNNNVAIQSATLVVQYPLGTKSVSDENKELYIERFPLETIEPGQTLNIPLRAVVYGEENEERTITATIEYRVEGSNALFYKEAEPLRFKISSSPVVLKVEAVKKLSSGQETTIELTVTSNSPNPIDNVLVTAEYPDGFDFTSSAPEPVRSDNMWSVGTLEPEGHKTITIRGLVVGKDTDEKAMHFSVGIPSERDPYTLASIFTTTDTEFEIEQPFINLDVSVGNSSDAEVVLEPGQRASVQINLENTLENSIYDAVVEAKLSGNALADMNVGQPSGFYDSRTNTITWDETSVSELEEINPGGRERLSFTVTPAENTARTPELTLTVNVRGRRVSERDVAEVLIGTAERTIRVASAPDLTAEVLHGSGEEGSVPPRAGEETSYNLGLLIDNGSNEIINTEVTTTLPTYVKWLNDTSGTGDISFNPTSRVVTWKPGTISANQSVSSSFRVSIEPSTSQIGTAPTLMGEQRLRATDNFTGSVIRSSNAAATTELSSGQQGSGRVQSN